MGRLRRSAGWRLTGFLLKGLVVGAVYILVVANALYVRHAGLDG